MPEAPRGITRSLTSLLVGISPHDPATLAAVVAILGTIALIASYLPGRRATRVDPANTLRYDEERVGKMGDTLLLGVRSALLGRTPSSEAL